MTTTEFLEPFTPEETDALAAFRTFCEEETDALAAFRTFCEDEEVTAAADDWDLYDLSLGFFLGRGLSLASSCKCARAARYDYHYWSEE